MEANDLLKRKHYKDLVITENQKIEIQKVLDFLFSSKNKDECILKKQNTLKIMPYMIQAGVDNLFLQRIIRKQKYSKNRVTLYGMLILYGEKGYEYWNNYCKKQSKTNTYEYKKEKYGWTKEQFAEFNKSRAVTKDNLIKRHGSDKGLEIWSNYKEKQKYTNSLEYYYEKYGKDNGYYKWIEYNKSKALTLENFIKKYGNEIGKEKFIEYWDKKHNNFFSNISQELFWCIYKDLKWKDKLHTYFATLNKEFRKYNGSGWYFYDFVITNKNICIEFNGDDWHANPKKYLPDAKIPIYESLGHDIKAREIWENDNEKNAFIKKAGYDIIIVWESDYKNDPDKVIKKCIERIYNGI